MGWTVAEQLAGAGERVRVLTRSGGGPDHPHIEKKQRMCPTRPSSAALFEGASGLSLHPRS